MSVSPQPSHLSMTPEKRQTARKSTATPNPSGIYQHVPTAIRNTSRKSTTQPSQIDVNRIESTRQGRKVLGVRHRNRNLSEEPRNLEALAQGNIPPLSAEVLSPVLSQVSTTSGGDENNPQIIEAEGQIVQRRPPFHVSPNASSGYSSRRSSNSQSQVVASKPDPLVRMNQRIRKRINERYEGGPRLGPVAQERRVGRGKDERLLRQALMRKRRSDKSDWRRLKAHLRDDDVRCPKTDIPLAPFVRLVKELAIKECSERNFPGSIRFQHAALLAIRDAAEGFMVNMFEQCSLFIAHAGRVTLMNKDVYLSKRLWIWKVDNNDNSNKD